MAALVEVLDRIDLVDLAGEGSYYRGVGYAQERRAELQEVTEQRVDAVVAGTVPYRVTLAVAGRGLEWSCTCPVGATGDFCKHAVAVALALTGEALDAEPSPDPDVALDLPGYVASLDPAALAAIVLEQAAADWRLHERLVTGARARLGLDVDEASWRKRVDAAFRRRGRFVEYRNAPEWANGVFDVLDGLAQLLEAGHGATVIPLAERCHRKAEAAVGYVDDSDGYITDIFHRVAELHLLACAQARPAPVPLAKRLAKLELTAELDTFHRAAARYADVLGASGLAAYRKVVEPQWLALDGQGDRWSHHDFRVRQAMIGLAYASGDPDELIRVMDVRTPYDEVEIVEFLRATGRADDALARARAGLEHFVDRPHQLRELRDLTAELLQGRGDAGAAVDVFVDAFAARPNVDDYRRLLVAAELTGDVDARRRWAHQLVESDSQLNDVSVMMLMHDGDVEAAWLAATLHGCDQRLWLELARAREQDHPLDVIAVYVDEVERAIAAKNKTGYRRAVTTLTQVEQLAARGGDPDRFRAIVVDVRDRHHQKRSLIALLDQRAWPT